MAMVCEAGTTNFIHVWQLAVHMCLSRSEQSSSYVHARATTTQFYEGAAFSVDCVLPHLLQFRRHVLDNLRTRFLRWTKPLTSSSSVGTLADLGRSKPALIVENALLRQQLIILHRQVKQPACTQVDRTLLVLLARLVRNWKQALLIVQPDTLLRLPSGALSPGLETQVTGRVSCAEGRSRNRRLDQGNGGAESTLGGRAYPWGTPETRHSRMQANYSEVHATRPHTTTKGTKLGDVSAQSCSAHLGL